MSETKAQKEDVTEKKNLSGDSEELVSEPVRKKIVLLSIFSLLVSILCLFLLSEKSILEKENFELRGAVSELDYRVFEMQQKMKNGFDHKDAFFTESVKKYKDTLIEIDNAFRDMPKAMDKISMSIVNGLIAVDKMLPATGDGATAKEEAKKRVRIIAQHHHENQKKVFVPAEKP